MTFATGRSGVSCPDCGGRGNELQSFGWSDEPDEPDDDPSNRADYNFVECYGCGSRMIVDHSGDEPTVYESESSSETDSEES